MLIETETRVNLGEGHKEYTQDTEVLSCHGYHSGVNVIQDNMQERIDLEHGPHKTEF